MTRWKCICAYDGTDYQGWQSQSSGRSVQDAIESALAKVLKHACRIHGAGRTDAGVHAHGQTFHFDADWDHNPENLRKAVNALLPTSIRLRSLEAAPPDFHARHSACGKRYIYRLSTAAPDPFTVRYCWHLRNAFDPDLIRAVLPALHGAHNFTAFAGKVKAGENPVKTLHRLTLQNHNEPWDFIVEGSGFLYRMVRSLTGTLADVAAGKLPPDRIPELLAGRKRTSEVVTAPAHGLYLDEIFYNNVR